MTDEKVETPDCVTYEEFSRVLAELERVKGERDEIRSFHDACIKDMYQMLGIDGSDGELRYKWCALEISKLTQRATTAEAALEKARENELVFFNLTDRAMKMLWLAIPETREPVSESSHNPITAWVADAKRELDAYQKGSRK